MWCFIIFKNYIHILKPRFLPHNPQSTLFTLTFWPKHGCRILSTPKLIANTIVTAPLVALLTSSSEMQRQCSRIAPCWYESHRMWEDGAWLRPMEKQPWTRHQASSYLIVALFQMSGILSWTTHTSLTSDVPGSHTQQPSSWTRT